MRWYIFFSRKGNSPTVTKKLIHGKLPAKCSIYVPCYYKFQKYRKTQVNKVSLYPFYLFIRCPSDDVALDLEQELGVTFGFLLKNTESGTPISVTDEEIRKIQKEEDTFRKKSKKAEKPVFKAGDTVEVTYGPLCGVRNNVVGVTEDYVFIQIKTTTGMIVEIPCKAEDLKKVKKLRKK